MKLTTHFGKEPRPGDVPGLRRGGGAALEAVREIAAATLSRSLGLSIVTAICAGVAMPLCFGGCDRADGESRLHAYVRRLERSYNRGIYWPEGTLLREDWVRGCEAGDPRACVRQGLHIDGFFSECSESGIPGDAAAPFYRRACELGLEPACRMLRLGPGARLRGIDVPLGFLRERRR